MRKHTALITFSGVDGSGKSTQIAHLASQFACSRKKTELLAFWDDVVVFTRYREGFVHAVYKSERGIGAPGKPVHRRDKNVRHWYLTLARHLLYFLDALNLRRVIARSRHRAADFIIMDRYIYDELANLPLSNPFTRTFVHFLIALVPKPDVAFFLDADPAAAVERKPEYPLEFMRECRQSYKALAQLLGNITFVPILPIDETRRFIAKSALCGDARGGARPHRGRVRRVGIDRRHAREQKGREGEESTSGSN
jgi:thymidylate kinase